MQTYQLEMNDNISDKILWLLGSFKNDVTIKKIEQDNLAKLDELSVSVSRALKEADESKKNNKPLTNAWDVLDDL
ncbi:MAG: hypothetical protein DRQ51_04320 [Gammaproteobacteria bacterium]|nr:MAG: hypothetical protein DRQ51_04320 [Gammaproteobacteria bacterium]